MYVSKPPSRNRINLSELSAPPEASNSGFLVVRDRESEQYDEDTSCCCCGPCITGKLLFPQNTILSNSDESNYGDKLLFLPEMSLRNQMKKSSFYKLNLEQYWEEIYPCDINNGNKGNAILLDASDVQREVNFLGGRLVTYEEMVLMMSLFGLELLFKKRGKEKKSKVRFMFSSL
ncbi:hypothetical protein WN943_002755 [Citrus x changshan-huyou]